MNGVLGNVLSLIGNNIGTDDAPWMNRIAGDVCRHSSFDVRFLDSNYTKLHGECKYPKYKYRTL